MQDLPFIYTHARRHSQECRLVAFNIEVVKAGIVKRYSWFMPFYIQTLPLAHYGVSHGYRTYQFACGCENLHIPYVA